MRSGGYWSVCLCVSVCRWLFSYCRQRSQWVQHYNGLILKNGNFRKSTAFKSYGEKHKQKRQYARRWPSFYVILNTRNRPKRRRIARLYIVSCPAAPPTRGKRRLVTIDGPEPRNGSHQWALKTVTYFQLTRSNNAELFLKEDWCRQNRSVR